MPNQIFPSSRPDRIRNMLAELVAFDTISDRTNLPLIAHIERFLAALGVKGERITDETGEKASLWVTIGPDDRPGYVLSGHTDVVPADCEAPRTKRRMALYLRTSRDPLAERTWSAPVTLIESLPAETEIRVAKARGMDRWAVAYTCSRPVTASGGPVADICLHYTADLSPGSITALALYA